MKFNKPKFWDTKNSFYSYLLLPLSLILLIFIFFKKKFTQTLKFEIPIICIGNIYVGGTGKTPTSILLARELFKMGRRPAIVRKFYEGHEDEHVYIQNEFKNLILSKSRDSGINEAEKNSNDIVILDDGFQDYKIKKDLNILCFNSNQLTGNGFVLPAGPLRENLNSLRRAHIVLINGDQKKDFEQKLLKINKNLNIFYSHYKPLNMDEFKNKKILALAGIGNPENFFKLIEKNNLMIEEKIIFPDHYKFSYDEISKIIVRAKSKNLQIMMTEKDYFKVKHFKLEKLKFLKVSLEINKKQEFLNKVNEFYV